MKHHRLGATAVALLALTIPLSCSSSDGKASSSTTSKAKTSATTTTAPKAQPTNGAEAKVEAVPVLKDPVGIIKDVAMTSCDTKSGPVTAKGTAKNTGTAPTDIAVTVAWTLPTGNTVNARGVAVLKGVAPGAQKDWTITSTVSSTDPVQCVLGAQRGQSS
jgi:hypothetical protein